MEDADIDSNMTSYNHTTTYEVNIFFAAFFPLLILATVIPNLATVIAFWKLPSLREKPSELLILNLSCADLLTGAILLPLIAPLYITPGYWPLGENGCRMVLLFINMGVNGSLYALVTISVDRFLLVYMSYPKYMKRITRTLIYKVIAVGWGLAFVCVLFELGLWGTSKRSDQSAILIEYKSLCLSPSRRVQSFSLVYFLIVYFFPVLLVCGMSMGFLIQLRRRLRRKVPSNSLSSGAAPTSTSERPESVANISVTIDTKDEAINFQKPGCDHENNNIRRMTLQKTITRGPSRSSYIKPGVTLVGLVLVMTLCMLPYCVYVIAIESGCEHCNDTSILFGLLLLQFCNACLDPFIYALTRHKIRQFYFSCLCQ